MGEQNIAEGLEERELRAFMMKLLEDVRALEMMLDRGLIESGVRRIGAEQEMFLVDRRGDPAPVALAVIERLADPAFTTELALFNLEANLAPHELGGRCLRTLERDLRRVVTLAGQAAQTVDAEVVLTGILPTISLAHLGLDAMTPLPRYHQLNRVLTRLRGGSFQPQIKGLDELHVTHDNILLEACNTSFQIHFQVGPSEFAQLYNLAQAVTAPVLAAAVNSPTLLQHRLWSETRIALFQQSIDARSTAQTARGRRTRVSFGERWVPDSVIDIFREDIARMRVVMATKIEEDAPAMVERGEIPTLAALCLHNGTVYRWNRPCYGVADGKAHLRIENRALPSGPTPVDEVANAAFYFGLMTALGDEYGDITRALSFDDAKSNFNQAARHGLSALFTWTDGKEHKARDLVLDHLLPLAREGLRAKAIDAADIDRYLGVLDERVRGGQTGSQWMTRSLAAAGERGTLDERYRTLVKATIARQKTGLPVHTWELAGDQESAGWWHSYRHVSQVMTRDLVTVRPQDVVDLAASVMDWERLRYVPVENDAGQLVGLVTHRTLLRLFGRSHDGPFAVQDIMLTNVLTISPGTRTLDALRMMREEKIGCLPVVDAGHLVGLVTETTLLDVASKVLEAHLLEAETATA